MKVSITLFLIHLGISSSQTLRGSTKDAVLIPLNHQMLNIQHQIDDHMKEEIDLHSASAHLTASNGVHENVGEKDEKTETQMGYPSDEGVILKSRVVTIPLSQQQLAAIDKMRGHELEFAMKDEIDNAATEEDAHVRLEEVSVAPTLPPGLEKQLQEVYVDEKTHVRTKLKMIPLSPEQMESATTMAGHEMEIENSYEAGLSSLNEQHRLEEKGSPSAPLDPSTEKAMETVHDEKTLTKQRIVSIPLSAKQKSVAQKLEGSELEVAQKDAIQHSNRRMRLEHTSRHLVNLVPLTEKQMDFARGMDGFEMEMLNQHRRLYGSKQ